MRSLKAGLIAVAVPSLIATLLVAGCSADGSSDLDPTTEPAATEPSDNTVIAPNDDDNDSDTKDSGSKDAGKKDASPKSDAGKDSGPPAPNEGDPCTGATKFTRACGNCGTQEAYCVADNADGGTSGKVGPYTACNQAADACTPGETTQEACGNCGQVTKTCSNQCKWTSSACSGQPTNSCVPGSVQWAKGACTTGYTSATCSASCQWSAFSPTCTTPVNDIVMNIPASATAAASSIDITLSASKVTDRMPSYDTCPVTDALSTGAYPYSYVEVKNTTNQNATVTVYASAGTSGAVIDTIMAIYDIPVIPLDVKDRKNCKWGVDDQSSSGDPTGDTDFSLIEGVSIPANSSVLVYVSSYYKYSSTTPAESTGTIKLNVKRTN